MARLRHNAPICPLKTATAFAVAVMTVLAMPADAGQPKATRQLAAELLILRGDLYRLTHESNLSTKNREGLRKRSAGALGLLPWLLRQVGDAPTAERLRTFQQVAVVNAAPAALLKELNAAIARHPLDRAAFLEPPPTPERLREARVIHRTYCAGCHDGANKGSQDLPLPARDLFQMARMETTDEFLARIFIGVKGDSTIHFANPLTDMQIGALLAFYRVFPGLQRGIKHRSMR